MSITTPCCSCSEWRSGVAGHLILSDEDLTSVVQGSWKRLNTLQHYKVTPPSARAALLGRPNGGPNRRCVSFQVPDGATVALVPRHTKNIHHDNHDYIAGESEFPCRNHLGDGAAAAAAALCSSLASCCANRDSHAGGCRRGRREAVAPGEGQRGARAS